MKKILQIFIAIIPLIVSFSTTDPTLSIRFFVFSILISGILLYYLIKNKAIYKEVIIHPAMLSFGILIIFFIFSAFYNGFGSESIYVLLRFSLVYLFAIILIHFVKNEGFKSLLNSFVYFSLFISFFYFFQIFLYYSDILSINSIFKKNYGFDAMASTMGNKNLLSSIQFLTLPILIYISINGRKFIKTLSYIALILIVITFLLNQTRSVFVSLVIFSFTILILNKNILAKKYLLRLVLFVFLFSFSSYFFMKWANRDDNFIEEIDKSLNLKSGPRYKLYKSSLKLIQDNPIFGVGPGNWSVYIWKYGLYNGFLGKSFAQRPHNDFLWVFAEGGFIAGISYILLFLILLKDSYYLYKNKNEDERLFYSLLFSCFLGYGFISLVDFPIERFSHNIIFFVLASFVISERLPKPINKISNWIIFFFLGICLFSVYVSSIRYQAKKHIANAIYYKEKGNWNYVIQAIDKSYNKTFYNIEKNSIPLLWYRGIAYFNQQKYTLALKDFKDAYKVNPYNIHVLNNLATSFQIQGDSPRAKKYYMDALSFNSTFKESRINLAAILYNEKQYIEALDIILRSKVESYSKRKKNNFQDNYDLYLKTIAKAWMNSVINDVSLEKSVALQKWMQQFDKKPYDAQKLMYNVYDIRKKENIDYLDAFILYQEKDL
tara:strand:+ start:7210 stop:9192 length:1983 start_codon:yes stop_codon:yes gene_type:complete